MPRNHGLRLFALLIVADVAQAALAAAPTSPPGMVYVPAGEFWMGADEDLFEDALPRHRVRMRGFFMDVTEVSNAEFTRFVTATGHLTVAERPLDPREFPGAPAAQLKPGSVVFNAPAAAVPLDNPGRWWRYVPGASWRHPEGPRSSIAARMDHPVVHIAYEDAQAYARWARKRLPTEAEWEYAARAGIDGRRFVWGNEFRPHGRYMANTFQGNFPDRNSAADGYAATAPVRHFPPNKWGIYGMAGNVWEWVADWYRPDYYRQLVSRGPLSIDPRGPASSEDPAEPGVAKRVQRGGSFLCTDDYCASYRPGARGRGEPSSGANHLGFRLVRDL